MRVLAKITPMVRCFVKGHNWSVASGYIPLCVDCGKPHPDGELIMRWLRLMEAVSREQTIKDMTDTLVEEILKSAQEAPKAELAPKVITRKKFRDDLH